MAEPPPRPPDYTQARVYARSVWNNLSRNTPVPRPPSGWDAAQGLQEALQEAEYDVVGPEGVLAFIERFYGASWAAPPPPPARPLPPPSPPRPPAALAEAREALRALPDDAAHALGPEPGGGAAAGAPPAPESTPPLVSPGVDDDRYAKHIWDRILGAKGIRGADRPGSLEEALAAGVKQGRFTSERDVRRFIDEFKPGQAPPAPAPEPTPFTLPLPEPPPPEPPAAAEAPPESPPAGPAPPPTPAGPPAAALSPRELKDLERLAGGRGEGAALLKLLQEQGAVAGPEAPPFAAPSPEPPVPPAGPTAPPPAPAAAPPPSPFTLPLPETPAAATGAGGAGGLPPAAAAGPAPWDDFTGLVQAAEEAEAEEEEPQAAPAPGAGRRPARPRRPKGYGREDLSLPGPRPSLLQSQVIQGLEGLAGWLHGEPEWAKEATPEELAAVGMADEGPFTAPDLPGAEAGFGPRGGFTGAAAGAGGEAGGPLVALLERIASAVERLVELAEQEDEGGSQGGGWGPARAAGVGAAHGTGEDYVAASPSVGWDLFRPGAEDDASGRPARKRPKGSQHAVTELLKTVLG